MNLLDCNINHVHWQKRKDYSLFFLNRLLVCDFTWNLILTKLSENKVLTFFLWHFIKGAWIQVNVQVCHTYYCKKKRKKIEELFTLFSEQPFLADLVFWLYYIVLQFALLFLFIKILKYVYVTVQSVIERKSHWQKLTYCNFFQVRTCIRQPWRWKKKNKKTFLFNNLFISFLKTAHILLRDTAFYTGYVKEATVR